MNLYRFVRGDRRHARCSAGTSRASTTPTATRRRRRGSPRSGARTRRWSRRSPTGRRSRSSRRSSRTRPGCASPSAGCTARRSRPGRRSRRRRSASPLEELTAGAGIVDYVVGAAPSPGVFVLGTHDDPLQRHYLNLYKLGEGPLYCFYTPYHLCHFEVPTTVARAVLFGDAAIAPAGGPLVEVVTAAKTDLAAGATTRRPRRLHDLRPGRERRRRGGRAAAADRARRGLPPQRATSRATRCSPTTTSSCPRAGSPTSCAPSRTQLPTAV